MSRSASRLFLAVLALMAVYALYLIAGHRVPPNAAAFEPGGLYKVPHASSRVASIVGMMLEELLLLVGVWRLATRYFASPQTRFFVAVSALGSSLWVDAQAPNLREVAALPLILSLLHEALETPSRSPLLLAGSLTLLQAVGKSPSMSAVTPTAAILYFGAAALLFDYPLKDRLRDRAWRAPVWIGAAALLGLAPLVAQASGAPPSGFGPLRLSRLADLALGISPSSEVAAFCGFLTLACAGLALTLVGAKRSMLLLLVVLVGMPLPLLPLLRLLVLLLAGLGFQGLIDGRFRGGGSIRAVALMLALLSLGLAPVAEWTLIDPAALRAVSDTMAMDPTTKTAVLPVQRVGLASDLRGISALMAALASGTLFLWNSGRRAAPLALGLALFLHPLDVFGWKFRMTWLNTAPLSPQPLSRIHAPLPLAWTVVLGLLSIFWVFCIVRMSARILRGGTA